MKSEIRKGRIGTPRQVLALGLIAGGITLAGIGCSTTSAAKKGSPAAYKVVFENEKVRVIEYHTRDELSVRVELHPEANHDRVAPEIDVVDLCAHALRFEEHEGAPVGAA